MRKSSLLVISSVLATSIFSSVVSAAETEVEQVKPYSIDAIEKAFPDIPEEVKNLEFKIVMDNGKEYLTDKDVTKVSPEALFSIFKELEDEISSGKYTEVELNKMAATKIKQASSSTEIKQTIPTKESSVMADYSIPGFGSLTDAEVSLAKKHPIEFTKYGAAAVSAKSESEKYYGGTQLYKGNGDAFRHSFWNALLVISFGGTNQGPLHGVNRAKAWTDAHEQNSSGIDKEMDLINNEIGRQYAYTNYYQTNSQLSSGLRKMVGQGTMVRIVNNNLVATNGTTGK
ncbi:DUF6973 domain-containing protein [Bacillus infantis]|uniref:DUF6973 domain-containing protein n=1 Tax=Bacillus infantis TaxID=324767 RepID=UPI003CF08933